MKRLFFFAFVGGAAAFSAGAQKLKQWQVPVAAMAAFEKEYPGLKGTWDKEHDNYEVNFKQSGKSTSVVIDKNGTIVETENDIPVGNLPLSVRNYMKKHYPRTKIKEAARIEKGNGDVRYEAEVNHKDVIFDVTGKFIKEEKD